MHIASKHFLASAIGALVVAGTLFSTASHALPVPPANGYEIITYYNQAKQVVGQQTLPSTPCQGQVSGPNWGSRTAILTWQTFQCPVEQGPYRLRH